MAVPCPICKKPMKADMTAKRGDRVFATLVCEGPHDPKAEMTAPDPRASHRPPRREANPL
jgi:hypothetical protein